MRTASNAGMLGTIANMPPEKRRVVCAAFNAFTRLATNAKPAERVMQETVFLGRILKNLSKLEPILARTGTLTGRDVVKNCFPDIPRPGNYDTKTLRAWEAQFDRDIVRDINKSAAILHMMESTGATYAEAADALARGRKLPVVPYYSDAQYSMEEASSVADCGISTMNTDICRCEGYVTIEGGRKRLTFPGELHSWKFNFPDGERLKTNGAMRGDIPRVGEKIKQLCGEVHPKQIGTVAYMLSQSGLSALIEKPLRAKYGISTTEHSPVDFTLSRNAETGAVTITYTSPKELPVQFTWTATVAVDGTVSSTPFTITSAPLRELSAKDAKAMVQSAARVTGRNLSDREISAAADILRRNANGLLPKNAKLFAQFVVKLPLAGAEARASGRKADAFAREIKDWLDFDLGDPAFPTSRTR